MNIQSNMQGPLKARKINLFHRHCFLMAMLVSTPAFSQVVSTGKQQIQKDTVSFRYNRLCSLIFTSYQLSENCVTDKDSSFPLAARNLFLLTVLVGSISQLSIFPTLRLPLTQVTRRISGPFNILLALS